MMEKVRFGIIGLGNQGSMYAAHLFGGGKIEHGVVTALCDINPAKIAEKIKAGLKREGEGVPLASADEAASATPSSGDTPQRPESLDGEVENG